MLGNIKYLIVPVALVSSWLVFLSYQVCPNQPTLAVNEFGCKILRDHLNSHNLNAIKDNAWFNYQIYLQPRFTYFAHFVWPKYVALYHVYAAKAEFFWRTAVWPTLSYYLELAKLNGTKAASAAYIQLLRVWTTVRINLGVWHYKVVSSPQFEAFTHTRVYFYLDHVCQLLHQLIQKTNFRKIQEKTHFLRSEFSSLIELKFKNKSFFKGQQNVVAMIKNLLDDTRDDDSSDYDDDEVETIVVTQTVYDAMATLTPLEIDIKKFLAGFEEKIDRTVDLALKNIENDVEPLINSTIEGLRPQFTNILQNVAKNNHEYYKKCHSMIQNIEKDASVMKDKHELVEEDISRQDMRDILAEVRAYNEEEFTKIEGLINQNFESVVNSYLQIIQDTIDVLESFADSTFQDFSNRLTQILSESENEGFNWNTWKEFHKLKTKVLDKRDFIFDQAKLVKATQFDKVEIETSFSLWLEFIKSIDFHIGFVSRDNEEYLQLIRAKANLAYQLREATVFELKKDLDKPEESVAQESTDSTPSPSPSPEIKQEERSSQTEAKPVTQHAQRKADDDDDADNDDGDETDIESDEDPDFSN